MMPSIFKHDRKALFLLTALLLIIGIVQAQNMFRFPYYHDEEGTHMANGWAMASEGKLSPYTYSYENPPGGTLLVGGWLLLTGGTNAFGFPLNSGRILMLILHIATTALIFMISKKITRSTIAASIAALVFAFSPLAASMQRVVYMENIMIVWLLASFYFAVGEKRTLFHYYASALFFGMAFLTEESAIFFLPALLYTVYVSSDKHHRRFATALFTAIAILLASFYPLYAQMKQELFPEGTALGGNFPHVSLIERLSERGPDTGRALDYGSGLASAIQQWVDLKSPVSDPVIIYIGAINCLFVLLLSIDHREIRPLLAMLLAEVVHLLLGGPVYVYDVILLLPFLALGVSAVAGQVQRWLWGMNNDFKYVLVPITMAVMLYPFWSFYGSRLDIYTQNQVDGQVKAAEWVAKNLPQDAVVVTDDYAFLWLRETHPNTQSYWRVDTDPAVKFAILGDDVCNIDYVIATPQIFSDITTFNMELMRRTIENSDVLMTYANDGWPIEIRQVKKTYCVPTVNAPASTTEVASVSQQTGVQGNN
jgi:4-amino-4-deoxy-L-arabinose transferase-like glycosyltransferase